MTTIGIITDNDFNKVSGVTTALRAVLRHAPSDLRLRVYTADGFGVDEPDYCAMASWGVGLPWYPEMRVYWPRVQRLRRLCSADGVNVLHLTTPGPMGLAARWIGRGGRYPMVGSYHTYLGEYLTTYSGSPAAGRALEQYTRWIYAPCSAVLVPSEETLTRLTGFGYPSNRLQVWSRGVDSACFRPSARSEGLRTQWSVDRRRLAILYVGRLSSEKGLAWFGPLQQALGHRRIAHRFIFVGDGPFRATLQSMCPDAVFLGSVPTRVVAAAMASADVFVFPSTTDTLGNVVLEAQASGCPVLVTDRGGPQEHMTHDVTGWVCTAGDMEAFAGRIATWRDQPDLRHAMGAAAVEFARARDWRHALEPLYSAWRVAAVAAPSAGLARATA